MDINNLPGSFGFPVVGEAHEAFIYKQQFYLDRYYKYKKIFKTQILDQKAVVLFGSEACSAVLEDKQEIFLSRKGWKVLEEFLGNGILMQDGEAHKRARKIIGKSFSVLSHENLHDIIFDSCQKRLYKWSKLSQVFIFQELRRFTFDVIFRLVFGSSIQSDIDYLEQLFSKLVDGQLDVFRLNTPLTAYGRALISRSKIYEYVFNAIHNLAIDKQQNSGILNSICAINSTISSANCLSTEEIAVQIIQILFAGYETSANLIFWAIFSLYKHTDVQMKIRKEISQSEYNLKDFNSNYRTLEYCILETERLFPPVYAIPRGLTKDFSYNQFVIPKSWNVIVSPLITHRLESIFENPQLFYPERFKDVSLRKKLFGFGAGNHRCLGKEIAKLEATIFIYLILQKYNFQILPSVQFHCASLNPSSFIKNLFIGLSPR